MQLRAWSPSTFSDSEAEADAPPRSCLQFVTSSPRCGAPPTQPVAALTTVDGADEKGYSKLPPLEEAVAAHLFPPSA